MAGRRVYKPKIIIITGATHSYTHTFVRDTYVYIRWRPIGVYIHTYRINEATRRRMFNEQRHEFAIGTEIYGRLYMEFKPIFPISHKLERFNQQVKVQFEFHNFGISLSRVQICPDTFYLFSFLLFTCKPHGRDLIRDFPKSKVPWNPSNFNELNQSGTDVITNSP